MDCSDITVSENSADGLMDTAIDAGNSTGCAEDAAGGYIAATDNGISNNCADTLI